jgi:hypothetical protein
MIVKVLFCFLLLCVVVSASQRTIVLMPGGEHTITQRTICLDLEYRSQISFNAQVWLGDKLIQNCQGVKKCSMTCSNWTSRTYLIHFTSNSTKTATLTRHGADYLCVQELIYPLIVMISAIVIFLIIIVGGLIVGRYCYRPKYKYEYGVFVPV